MTTKQITPCAATVLKAMGLRSRHTKSGNVIDIYDGDNEAQLKYLTDIGTRW